MMQSVFICLAVAVASVASRVAPPAPFCSAVNEGQTQYGCWGYHTCFNGGVQTLLCPDGQMLLRDDTGKLICVTEAMAMQQYPAHTACFTTHTCNGRADAYYADYEMGCTSYYRCNMGQFIGHFYCPPNTFFDTPRVQCDYHDRMTVPEQQKCYGTHQPLNPNNPVVGTIGPNGFLVGNNIPVTNVPINNVGR